jgi:hypothetical protein
MYKQRNLLLFSIIKINADVFRRRAECEFGAGNVIVCASFTVAFYVRFIAHLFDDAVCLYVILNGNLTHI